MPNSFIAPLKEPSIEVTFADGVPQSLRALFHATSQPTTRVVLTSPPRKVWQFPQERFVTYEPSDESWCRFAGVGREVEVSDSLEIPSAVITGISHGSVSFRGVPSGATQTIVSS